MAIPCHILSEAHMGDKRELKFTSHSYWNNDNLPKTDDETAMQKEITYAIE